MTTKPREKKKKDENDFNDLKKSIISDYNAHAKKEIEAYIPNDIRLQAKDESQVKLINSIKNNEITICSGSPGSGKTYVAVSQALTMLRKQSSPYKKIYLVKSVTPLKNEELGYLKGGLMEKIEPFMWSFYLNIEKIISEESLKSLLERNIIRPFPIAYMRGVTIDDSIVIIDEVQNITMDNIKTIMTRIGSNCKYILLGDINQVDLKTKSESSLTHIIRLFKEKESIGVIEMSSDNENIRNPIIKVIEQVFNDYEKEVREMYSKKKQNEK
jgi:phosphate starvation-inducible PhoH-like protein